MGKQHDLRPEVLAFAHLMEAKLRDNDHKPGWKGDHPLDLMTRMRQEVGELGVEVVAGSRTSLEAWRARVGAEAADVANFAMMVADVCGALDAARSEAQPSGYDGGKSLGERLYDAVVAADPTAKVVPWLELDSSFQTKMEKAALTFTASLSDASPKPAEGDA